MPAVYPLCVNIFALENTNSSRSACGVDHPGRPGDRAGDLTSLVARIGDRNHGRGKRSYKRSGYNPTGAELGVGHATNRIDFVQSKVYLNGSNWVI